MARVSQDRHEDTSQQNQDRRSSNEKESISFAQPTRLETQARLREPRESYSHGCARDPRAGARTHSRAWLSRECGASSLLRKPGGRAALSLPSSATILQAG